MSTRSNLRQPSDIEETCLAIHKINKHAKKYAKLAEQNYRKGKKATAKYNSLRKDALYSLKDKSLKRLYDLEYHDYIEKHEIDGRIYYCFYIDSWSYHSPVDEWGWNRPNDWEITKEQEIEEFDADSDTDAQDKISLKTALTRLQSEFGKSFNANRHLDSERVSYEYRSYFVGWDYL
jgi:hypothetical protein